MVVKGEIRRKGRVLKAAMARVQDGHPSLDCARCDGIFTQPRSFATEMGWRRYVRSTPIATLETDRVSFVLARQQTRRGPAHRPQWRVSRKGLAPNSLLVVARLNEDANAIQDYLLLPVPRITKGYLSFSDTESGRRGAVRVGCPDDLIARIKARLRSPRRADR